MVVDDFKKVTCPDGRIGVVPYWGATVYYTPENDHAFQWDERFGGPIDPLSYETFGSDAYWAEEHFERWLKVAKEACKELGLC